LNKGLARAKSSGFTLIEILVASLILCIFAVSFVFLMQSCIKQEKAAKELTKSIFISKSIMEELRGKSFGSLFSYNNTTFDNGAGRISVDPVGSDLASITIRHRIELNTLRSRY